MSDTPRETPPETQACKTPWPDIIDSARKHYEQLSNTACDWVSTIPHALDFYEKYGPTNGALTARAEQAEQERESAFKQFQQAEKDAQDYLAEVTRLRAALTEIVEHGAGDDGYPAVFKRVIRVAREALKAP